MARPQLPEKGRMTTEELAALPAVVDLRTAAKALGLGRDNAYQMARDNAFPVEVLSLGRYLRVRKADLMNYLHLNMDGTPLSAPVAGAA